MCGSNKNWYTEFYKAKKAGLEALNRFLQENPHPKKR